MMYDFDLDPPMHGVVPCPACGNLVHIVATLSTGLARWCCLACNNTGAAPLHAPDGESDIEALGREPISWAA